MTGSNESFTFNQQQDVTEFNHLFWEKIERGMIAINQLRIFLEKEKNTTEENINNNNTEEKVNVNDNENDIIKKENSRKGKETKITTGKEGEEEKIKYDKNENGKGGKENGDKKKKQIENKMRKADKGQ
eukprot:Anaeramoba_flamelloidesa828999_18.p1 GENE.a828999_18~~a828999_18.p1  ORF type:complete len:141 (-),score=46.76 a828999_18:93-479(-)